ncbi:MAG TPA: hypothetical protein VNN80_11015 [Polyangiaceae bacterium]|nr:hypothetical protein [Polyangiaceae bacterium]
MSSSIIVLLAAASAVLPLLVISLRAHRSTVRYRVVVSLGGRRESVVMSTNLSSASAERIGALLESSDGVVDVTGVSSWS